MTSNLIANSVPLRYDIPIYKPPPEVLDLSLLLIFSCISTYLDNFINSSEHSESTSHSGLHNLSIPSVLNGNIRLSHSFDSNIYSIHFIKKAHVSFLVFLLESVIMCFEYWTVAIPWHISEFAAGFVLVLCWVINFVGLGAVGLASTCSACVCSLRALWG